MKIIIALLVPILIGIVVGSNLSPVMTVVIFNQPTISLPIGLWLSIAVGAGLLSSLLIQAAILIDRRLAQRQIRQLQTRLQQSDQDIFTYTSSESEADRLLLKKPARGSNTTTDQQPIQPPVDSPAPKKSLFNSYRSQSVVEDVASSVNRSTKSPGKSPAKSIDEDDDWEIQPGSNRQLEWGDSTPSRQQNFQTPNYSSKIENDQAEADRPIQKIDNTAKQIRREVYDADFRLIKPPSKDPLETEFDDDRESVDFEYSEIDEDNNFGRSSSEPKPPNTNRSTASKNSDIEDWGFDFEDRDPPVRSN
jgi:hypothetical protein